jgi:hypothetical protein
MKDLLVIPPRDAAPEMRADVGYGKQLVLSVPNYPNSPLDRTDSPTVYPADLDFGTKRTRP